MIELKRKIRGMHVGRSLSGLLLLWLIMGQAKAVPVSQVELWNILRGGGNVLLIRHAQTIPGFGDPPGFRLNDCSSQRYLSDDGRAQSQRIGDRFRAEKVPVAQVLSSEWCRCYETAELAFGKHELWPPLNSFFEDYSTRDEQTQAVFKRIESFAGEGNLVLVTHQVNITALTGRAVSQGEAVVVRPDPERGFQVLGNIRFD